MIRRDASQRGLRALHLIAMVSFLAAIGFTNSGWAFFAGSPPQPDYFKLVADQPGSVSTANETAKKTLNVFCRAANLPHAPSLAAPVPAAQGMSAEEAKSTLDVIRQVSKTRRPLCASNGAAPNSALVLIGKFGKQPPGGSGHGVPPKDPGYPLPFRVRDIYYQINADQ